MHKKLDSEDFYEHMYDFKCTAKEKRLESVQRKRLTDPFVRWYNALRSSRLSKQPSNLEDSATKLERRFEYSVSDSVTLSLHLSVCLKSTTCSISHSKGVQGGIGEDSLWPEGLSCQDTVLMSTCRERATSAISASWIS